MEPRKKLTAEEHRAHHVELHNKLDELLACYLSTTGKLPSEASVYELMMWSFKMTTEAE